MTAVLQCLLDRFTPSFAPGRALADVAFDDFMADQVSHFVLCAAASISTTTYDHLVKAKITLSRRCLAVETSSDIRDVKLASLGEQHAASGPADDNIYFRVPFTMVLDLVAERGVYLSFTVTSVVWVRCCDGGEGRFTALRRATDAKQ